MGNNTSTTKKCNTPTILCFGSSLTAGYTVISPYTKEFHPYSLSLLKKLKELNLNGSSNLQIISVGGNGVTAKEFATSKNSKSKDNVDVCGCHYSGLTRLLADNNVIGVIIMAGTNDIANHEATPSSVFESLRTLHEIALQNGIQKTIALSIPPNANTELGCQMGHVHTETCQTMLQNYTACWKETNELLEKWSNENETKTKYVNVADCVAFSKTSGNWEDDGLHMSEQGYDCLGEALAGVVGKHFLNLVDVLLDDGTRVAMRVAE